MADSIQGIAPYHARYFAWELTRRRAASEDDRLPQSLFDASIGLNPQQTGAARFAPSTPIRKGVVLAARTLRHLRQAGVLDPPDREVRRVVSSSSPGCGGTRPAAPRRCSPACGSWLAAPQWQHFSDTRHCLVAANHTGP